MEKERNELKDRITDNQSNRDFASSQEERLNYSDLISDDLGNLRAINNSLQKLDSGKFEEVSYWAFRLANERSKLEANPSKVLAYLYKCRYRFRNPVLGGVEEETTKTFLLDTLKSRVVGNSA